MDDEQCIGCPILICDPLSPMCLQTPEFKLELHRRNVEAESVRLDTRSEKRLERIDRLSDPVRRRYRKFDGRGKGRLRSTEIL